METDEDKRNRKRDYLRRWREAHRDKVHGYQKKWRVTHPEEAREQHRKWAETHREGERQRALDWFNAHLHPCAGNCGTMIGPNSTYCKRCSLIGQPHVTCISGAYRVASAKLPAAVHERIERLAKALGQSRSEVIRILLATALELREDEDAANKQNPND